jgi:hypothetical protein
MFGWIRKRWKSFLAQYAYPDDPDERRKIKAYILGGGAAFGKSGSVKVEVEDGKGEKGEKGV